MMSSTVSNAWKDKEKNKKKWLHFIDMITMCKCLATVNYEYFLGWKIIVYSVNSTAEVLD